MESGRERVRESVREKERDIKKREREALPTSTSTP